MGTNRGAGQPTARVGSRKAIFVRAATSQPADCRCLKCAEWRLQRAERCGGFSAPPRPMSTSVFQSNLDVARNRVRVRFRGELSGTTLIPAVAQVRTDVAQLRPGFAVFADF